MQSLAYPLQFHFKITTLSNDFTVQDAHGQTICYSKQKMLKLTEEVNIYNDTTQSQRLYQIKADRWLDFSAAYTITDQNGLYKGKIARKGWASIWKSRYEIYDQNEQQDLLVREENPWVKIADALFSDIPIFGILSGYLFHPTYLVTRPDGTAVLRLQKEPSFWGRKFSLHQLSPFEKGEEERTVLGLMMMLLLERRRG